MIIPKPFSRGKLVMGTMIHVLDHAPDHAPGKGRDSVARDTLEKYRGRHEHR